MTVMKQFHADDTRQVVQLIGQYLRSVVEAGRTSNGDVGSDAATLVVALQWMLLYGAVTKNVRPFNLSSSASSLRSKSPFFMSRSWPRIFPVTWSALFNPSDYFSRYPARVEAVTVKEFVIRTTSVISWRTLGVLVGCVIWIELFWTKINFWLFMENIFSSNIQTYLFSKFDAGMYQVRTIFWHDRWSGAVSHVSNRMTRFNLQKRDKNTLCLGGGGGSVREKDFLYVVAKSRGKSENPRKISLSYSFAVEMGHFDMVTWNCDSVCIFSMLQDALEPILWKKADKNCKDRKRSIFFAKVALIGKSIFQIQRINAVHGRCSSSDVLRDIS